MVNNNKSSGLNFGKLTEEDVKYQYITPAIEDAGWSKDQLKFEFAFTDGKIQIKGNKGYRGAQKRADYLLLYKPSIPIAVVEAKDMNHAVSDGIQQAVDYAEILNIPFAYSSNGEGFVEHDLLTGEEKELWDYEFPSPEDLWQRYAEFKGISDNESKIIKQPDFYDPLTGKKPRYYQRIAINKTIEAIAQGRNRILLVMATGTGKTFTAFQIAYKLYHSGMKKKILYLADRNILIDQTMQQDFKPFEDVMTKVEHKNLDSSYEMYFSLYQQLFNPKKHEGKQPYEEFSPDFFDLIIVDECHRGSADANSEWRKILEYFHSATQIGMTATPKEDNDISTSSYFGEALYKYSLKDGIDDGFLAPYRVNRIGIDVDIKGYVPKKGQKDVYGNPVEQRQFDGSEIDKTIIIDDRTRVVAKEITKFLKENGRFSKTIVFCIDQEHALRMRQALINENKDLVAQNPKYIMRITSDDTVGKKQLDYFIDVESQYPTIVTTSELLSTGVDCKTCKLIVLDNHIASMTKFKQIIGRGTRLRTDYGKYFFTIMDFRDNTRLFFDPEFDGDPEPPEGNGGDGKEPKKKKKKPKSDPKEKRKKIRVKGVEVQVIIKEYKCFDLDGNLITDNIISYSKNNILNEYKSLEEFIHKWNESDKKRAIIDELYDNGVFLDEIREASGREDMDDFDLICHIAFDKKPLTRAERVKNVKKRDYLNKYEGVARKVLEGLLDKYATYGIDDLEDIKVLQNDPFKQYGSPVKITKEFGGLEQFENAIYELEKEIYAD